MRKILTVDIGGTKVKMLLRGERERRTFPSGPDLTPDDLVRGIAATTEGWTYDALSIGFPAPVAGGAIVADPVNLGPGWKGFDFAAALNKPVRLINDAAMQALGSYHGGTMLFLGLGTGLGTALVRDGVVVPLELGHLPYRDGRTFEEWVGKSGLKRLGGNRWEKAVQDVVERLSRAVNAEYVVIGGGNSKRLRRFPAGAERGSNANAFLGGFRLWMTPEELELEWSSRSAEAPAPQPIHS